MHRIKFIITDKKKTNRFILFIIYSSLFLLVKCCHFLLLLFQTIVTLLILIIYISIECFRFHRNDMRSFIFISILLAYFAQNVCYCAEDAAPKVFVPPEKYRLPRSILPEFYKLNVFTHINDDEGFKFYGDVRIKVIYLGY